ncbi:unnamed protein product [Rhizophagus irregularis]|uniref:K Homology domain-containing protein n=1 Tax=Rhizophagus irregularis TaxID=588596 RepID=A0A915ZG98_9GLOM|nr:unnamed protein product [Rhizophagus irregularis]CAB5373955.1 unnamed protein product [Rhizophagus irregularis]
MFASQKTKIIFKIPEEKSGLIFDNNCKNIKKIEENTGARIILNDDGTEATINGTYGQCEVAKSRIEVFLDNEAKKPRPSIYLELGFIILDTSRAMLSAADKGISSRVTPKIHFRKYDLKNHNSHSKGNELFYIMFDHEDSNALGLETSKNFKEEFNELERVIDDDSESSTTNIYDFLCGTTSERKSEDSNPIMWNIKRISNYENDANGTSKDLDTSLSEWEPNVSAPTLQQPFSIFSQLSMCMAKIISNVSEFFPVNNSGIEIKASLYLGRQLFFNVPSKPKSYSLSEWCKLRRAGPKGIKTSFRHDAPFVDGLRILQAELGFQEAESFGDSEKDKWSVTIYFNDGEDKKLKLNWDHQKRTWKVTKVVKILRHVILIDLISGSCSPDIRFLLKTQIRIPIDQKLIDLIENLQNSVNRDESDMSFRVKDFADTLNVTRVEQTINKRRFYNKDYRISIVPTKQDSDGTRVTYGNNVIIKHLDWIAMNKYLTQSYKRSLKNSTMEFPTSQHLSSPPLSTLSRSSSSIHSSSPPTPYEQRVSDELNTHNAANKITEEFDLISFDDEPLPTLLSINITNKTVHLLDDNSNGINQIKHILDDDSQMKIERHILDNDNELKNQSHILDDDYNLFGMENSQTNQDDYNEYDENFKNGEMQITGTEEEKFVREKNWKDILEFTIPNSLEYAREFCKTIS